MKISAKVNTAKYQHFNFCSFADLSKVKALQLSKVGLSTIRYQHSKNLTPKNTQKCNCLHEFVHKRCSVSTICADKCLETLSPLISCSVNNVSRYMYAQMVFKFPKVMQQHT